jgi:hypothetical protein
VRPETYKEALTNLKTATCKEDHPKDKLYEDDHELILAEISKVFCGTPKEELLYLESCAHVHMC